MAVDGTAWRGGYRALRTTWQIATAAGSWQGTIASERLRDQIVLAINSHDDLLAALERAATELRCARGMLRDCYLDKVHPCQPCAARKHAWDAIAKAEGGQP